MITRTAVSADEEPMLINGVEVFLDLANKTVAMIVRVKTCPLQMYTKEIQGYIARRSHCIMRYLEKEGYIHNQMDNWILTVSGISE